MPRSSARELATASFQLFFLFIIVGMYGAWLISLWWNLDNESFWQRDWHCLWAAGQQVWTGDLSAVYTAEFGTVNTSVCREGLFWLYPPYALYPVALFALLPPLPAYLGIMGLTVAACMLVGRLIARQYPHAKETWVVFFLGFLAASPVHSNVVLGQNSAWLTLAILFGVWGLQTQNRALAACAFSVLALKPNWILLFGVWLVVQKQWRTVGYLTALGCAFGVCSLGFGPDLWRDFFVSSRGYGAFVLETYPLGRLITSHATLRGLGWIDLGSIPWVWLLLQGLVLTATWVTWRSDRSLMAKAGITVLATITCNVYTNFYDALVLVVPVAVWWFERPRYRTHHWWSIPGLICATWLWLWFRIIGGDFYTPNVAPIGFLLVTWAVFEGFVSKTKRKSLGS